MNNSNKTNFEKMTNSRKNNVSELQTARNDSARFNKQSIKKARNNKNFFRAMEIV
jgi:hypothetical protein